MTDYERYIAESFARETTRRSLLNRAMSWTFATVSGVAVAGSFPGRAGAHTLNGQAHCANTDSDTFCNPPNGKLCDELGAPCSGHACPSGWSWSSSYGYGSACWCSAASGQKYWICCDCAKNGGPSSQDCGCAECVGSGCGARPSAVRPASEKAPFVSEASLRHPVRR